MTLTATRLALALVACAGTASAGGPVQVSDEAPVATPVTSSMVDWQGPYVGLSIGTPTGDNFFGRSDLDVWSTPVDWSGTPTALRIGYDWQRGRLVWGVALEGSFGKISNPTKDSENVACFGACEIAVTDLRALRGRVGFTTGRSLFYVNAGVATGYASFTAQGIYGVVGKGSVDGWTAGVGLEHRLGDHLTLTADYNYTDLGALPLNCFSTCQTAIKFGTAGLGVAYRW